MSKKISNIESDVPLYHRVRRRVQISFDDPSLTRQEFLQDTDPKFLMQKFGLNPVPEPLIPPMYGDTTATPQSYLDALNLLADVHEAFDHLPSAVRMGLNNSPAELLKVMQDPAGVEMLSRAGVNFIDEAGQAINLPSSAPASGQAPSPKTPSPAPADAGTDK